MDLSTSLKLTFAATDLRPPFIRRRKGLKLRFSPGKKNKTCDFKKEKRRGCFTETTLKAPQMPSGRFKTRKISQRVDSPSPDPHRDNRDVICWTG